MTRWMRLAVVGALAALPASALAAIDNTHHDMVHMELSEEKCAYCHSKTGVADADADQFGQSGGFCIVVCHSTGTGMPAGAVPQGPGYFLAEYTLAAGSKTADPAVVGWGTGGSHGNIKSLIPEPDAAGDVTATGWPHTGKDNMECTSCHAVHDATYPPFLNAPLSAHAATDPNADSFCQRCHSGSAADGIAGRYQDITGMGAHPTEFAYKGDGTVPAAAGTDKLARTMTIKAAVLYEVPTVAGGNFDGVGSSWVTGGHFIDTETGLPTATLENAQFGCYSCHSAHQDDAGENIGNGYSSASILTLAPADYLCYGCHGDGPTPTSGTNSKENPGASAYYHPVGGEGRYSLFPVPMAEAYDNVPQSSAPTPTAQGLICLSCHDVHGGVEGLMSIRQIGGSVSTASSVCLGCHAASTDNSGLDDNWHHPGQAVDYSDSGNGGFMADKSGLASWVTGDKLGDLTDGLSCPDCHVFQGTADRRATAHNW